MNAVQSRGFVLTSSPARSLRVTRTLSLGSIRQVVGGIFVGLVVLTPAFVVGERSERPLPSVRDTVAMSSPDREDEFPAIGCAEDGKPWVAWVSFDGDQDKVLIRPVDATSAPVCLSGSATDCWRPSLARDGKGRLWVVWAQNENGNWDLWARYLHGAKWSESLRLTQGEENDFCQQLTADSTGQVWMAWQSAPDGNYEILVARLTPEGLADRQNVSQHPANDWEPALAADQLGNVFVGWDSYRNGSYDILVSRLRGGQRPTAPRLIAGSADYEAHAALAVDRHNRLWIAWDNGGPHWGQHGEKRLRLHSQRSVCLACLEGDRLRAPAEGLSRALAGPLADFCELPALRVDGQGRLWLLVRHLEDVTPPGTRKPGKKPQPQQPRGIWNPFALCYTSDGWSQTVRLPASNGRNDMRTTSCLDLEGRVWVAWADDGRLRTRAEEPVNHEVHAARLELSDAAEGSLSVMADELAQQPAEKIPLARETRETYQVTVQGTPYRLLYGDTHRHTDISRCAMNFDGSLMDTYRYAIDAAGLDFLGISDHDQDLLKHRYGRTQQGPLQDYAWWRSQKYCDLFYIAGRFLPIYGYEHGGSYQARGGHKNVMSPVRGFPCYEEDAPEDLFRVLRGKDVVVIPHQLADGGSATDWMKWNSDFERIAEIFQARGSYEFFGAPLVAEVQREGHYLQDALSQSIRIGVIASSDHGLVHGSYAGVYAKEFSRKGVLEALRSRRSFGATEVMAIDFRLGDQLLGSEAVLDESPAFTAFARGAKPLESVEIVRDGKLVYSTNPGQTSCSFQFTDTDLKPGGSAYYYLRCQQADKQWGWSSAIWVKRPKR